MADYGYRTCDSTGCHVVTPQESHAWQSNAACDAWDKPGRITAVDGQSRSDYDKMIKNNFKFTQDNYGDAYKEAARLGKPVVAIFGSFENNNSKSLIQGALAHAGISKDAVFIYVDPTKCKDAELKKFAQSQLAGGHNAPMSIVFSVKPGQDGKPEPEAYTYRWQGDHPSMLPSFRDAISQAQERMNGYKGQFKTSENLPPAPQPGDNRTDVRPVQRDPRRHDQVKPQPRDEVNPRRQSDQIQPDRTQKKPVPDSDLYKYDGSGKKADGSDGSKNDGNGKTSDPSDLYKYDGSGRKQPPPSEQERQQRLNQAAEQERRNQAAEQQRRNQAAEQQQRNQAAEQQRRNQAAEQQQQRNQAEQAARQQHNELDQRHRDSLKWNSVKEQEGTRLAGAMTEARNQYPEIDNAQKVLGNIRFDLLDSYKAHAKMADARSMWSSEDTNHNAMANVAEKQRMNQWKQLVSEATAGGPTSAIQRQEQMTLYKALTGAGRPFSGSDFALDGDGRLQNHGAMWTGRCAETLVNTCKPGLDRKLAATLVPAAILDNNVPEADKLRLVDGLKNLSTKDQTGNAPLTREQEIVILTQALKVDREKQFGTHYAESLAPTHIPSKTDPSQHKETAQFLKHDKDDQVAFQTAVMKRLADLKAVEAVDALNVVKDHPTQAPLARAAEEQLARITPSVTELRQNVLSNPLLSPGDRSRYFDAEANADPRPDRRASAVIRYFGNQHFSNAADPGLARVAGLMDDGKESTNVRLAAASVLSDAQLPGARDKATKFAADLFCAKDPIQQYKDDAGEILNRMVPANQAREVVLSDGRVVVLYHGQDGKIAYADRGQKR